MMFSRVVLLILKWNNNKIIKNKLLQIIQLELKKKINYSNQLCTTQYNTKQVEHQSNNQQLKRRRGIQIYMETLIIQFLIQLREIGI
jgi:hypothetical protein